MTGPPKKRILEKEWAVQESRIRQLYLIEDLKLEGQNGVIETMKRRHNFFATKAQYEIQFRKWNWRKYTSSSEWAALARKLAQRKATGKLSVVYQNGRRIPETTVERETNRHALKACPKELPVSPGGTPQGYTVASPKPTDQIVISTGNLPFSLFERTLIDDATYQAFIGRLDHRILAHQLIQSSGESANNQKILLSTPDDDRNVILNRLANLLNLEIAPKMRAMMIPPPDFVPLHEPTDIALDKEFFRSVYLRFLIFSISNNFSGLESFSSETLWSYISSKPCQQITEFLQHAKGHTTRALAEKLFFCAVNAGDSAKVEFLLRNSHFGIDPNGVMMIDGRRCTPLQAMISRLDLETSQALLAHGADPTKLHELQDSLVSRYTHSKRSFLFKGGCLDGLKAARLQLLQLLISYGLEITPNLIESAIRFHELELVETIITWDVENSTRMLLSTELIVELMLYVDYETVDKVVHTLTSMLNTSQSGLDLPSVSVLEGALDVLARRGFESQCYLLHQNGVKGSLITIKKAIQSGNVTLARYFLDLELEKKTASGDKLFKGPNLLLLAIGTGSSSMIDLVMSHCGFDQFSDPESFTEVLATAVQAGNEQLVDMLFDTGLQRFHQHSMCEALCFAVSLNHGNIAMKLLDAGSRDCECLSGPIPTSHPLIEAIRQKQLNLTNRLLERFPSIIHSRLTQALPLAIEWGEEKLVENLLNYQVSLDGTAIVERHYNCLAVMDYSQPQSNHPPSHSGFEEMTALMISIERQDRQLMLELLNRGANINSKVRVRSYSRCPCQPKSSLAAAVRLGSFDLVAELLSLGADPEDASALEIASLTENAEVLNLLLKSFSQRYPLGNGYFGDNLLRRAIQKGQLERVSLLLDHNLHCFARAKHRSALGYAIEVDDPNRLAMIQLLLDRGSKPNEIIALEPVTKTALHQAIEIKSTSLVQYLLDRGADVNLPATGIIKRTPLQKAAEVGSFEVVKLLLDSGARVNDPPAFQGGGTAIQLAAIGGYCGIINTLVQHGGDVNAPPSEIDGRTALEGAAENGRLDTIGFLFAAGVRIDGPGYQDYKRSVERARDNGHMAVVELMESWHPAGPNSLWGECSNTSESGYFNGSSF